jgi:hypothetical protein
MFLLGVVVVLGLDIQQGQGVHQEVELVQMILLLLETVQCSVLVVAVVDNLKMAAMVLLVLFLSAMLIHLLKQHQLLVRLHTQIQAGTTHTNGLAVVQLRFN